MWIGFIPITFVQKFYGLRCLSMLSCSFGQTNGEIKCRLVLVELSFGIIENRLLGRKVYTAYLCTDNTKHVLWGTITVRQKTNGLLNQFVPEKQIQNNRHILPFLYQVKLDIFWTFLPNSHFATGFVHLTTLQVAPLKGKLYRFPPVLPALPC